MGPDIPDKRYFKIGEVSKLADAAPHVIRYWESEFSQITPRRAASNQRLYSREDVQLILQIKDLLHQKGFTIAGAKKILSDGVTLEQQAEDIDEPLSDGQYLSKIKSELLQLYEELEKKKQR